MIEALWEGMSRPGIHRSRSKCRSGVMRWDEIIGPRDLLSLGLRRRLERSLGQVQVLVLVLMLVLVGVRDRVLARSLARSLNLALALGLGVVLLQVRRRMRVRVWV